jgi:molybdopterin molybdotransferase
MKSAALPVSNPLSVDAAIAWVDASILRLGTEDAALESARRRVLAEDIRTDRAIPDRDCAMVDGFAVEASASLGASTYNPVDVPLHAIDASDALPTRSNAVVPLDLAQPNERGHLELIEAVAPGDNVDQRGAVAPSGSILVLAGTKLSARHIGLLALAGLGEVPVIRRPLVRIVLARPPRPGIWEDSNGPMLRAAIERDGGVVTQLIAAEGSRRTIVDALIETGADIVLVVGGTGPGKGDHSAAALVESGELTIHGIALRPGETTGFGRARDSVPVMLLPGAPAACLWSYELFAGRAVRRLGGCDPALPYRSREMTAVRKIVSSIGVTEICPVRCSAGDIVEPLPSFTETGLMAAVDADGFVIVPEGSEGYPQGARVIVHLYEDG